MDQIEQIKKSFTASISAKTDALEQLPPRIAKGGEMLVNCLRNQGKILCCGNGGSACDSLHFAAEMLNRFVMERPSLPAIALTADTATITAIGNDYNYDQIFAKQISALGRKEDVLLAISTSGNAKNIVAAIEAAHKNGLPVITLTGKDGGAAAKLLHNNDLEIRVNHDFTPRIQEVHILIIHCLCDFIEQTMFGN